MSEPITLASWNVNSLNVRKDQVLDLLRETGWDVLALQETKMTDAVFPAIAVAKMLETTPRLIVAGDFNIAPEDADVWDPAVWRGNLLVSAPERRALRRLMTLGFSDAYRIFPQAPKTYSWWDYRSRGYEKNEGLRIDLTLVSDALRPDVTAAAIIEGPRALPQPSDHAPVTVTFR